MPHPPQNRKSVGFQNSRRTDDQNIKPAPPTEPRGKNYMVRKFYDVRKKDSVVDESRVSGDGESLENEEFYEKLRCPSWERMPGDGCISDIAEEDEDAEEEDGDMDENDDDDDEESVEDNYDNDFYECDDLDEGNN